jgi:drug/metabolite transporter (DMT)-like permease
VQSTPRSPARGYTIALACVVFWSWTAILIRHLSEQYHMPPLVLAFWRDLFAVLSLALGLLVVRRSLLAPAGLRRHLPFFALYGLILAIYNALWTTSVVLNGAAAATVLAYSSPAFTALLARRLFGERLNAAKIGAVVLCITGCVLVSGAYDPGAWQTNPLGIAVGLVAGAAFAGYSLMGKAAARRGLSAWTSMVYTFGFATCFLLLLQRPDTILWLGPALSGWGILLLLAVLPTIGGYGLYTLSLEYLPASVASLLATLEPPLTALWAYLFLAEMMTGVQLVGAGVILGGVVLLRMGEGRETRGSRC